MGDVIFALLIFAATLPLMLLIALLVKVESPGPVFYRQERLGLCGKRFLICKFRSMVNTAEQQGPVWASHRDCRVTRVGRLIRLTRIDELPQVFNILKGEMSLIGPRPERPHFVDEIVKQIPLFQERTRVKPGLTGWAQINLPYGASLEDAQEKLAYDLYYVKHQTLLLDLVILLRTVRVVVLQTGAR